MKGSLILFDLVVNTITHSKLLGMPAHMSLRFKVTCSYILKADVKTFRNLFNDFDLFLIVTI